MFSKPKCLTKLFVIWVLENVLSKISALSGNWNIISWSHLLGNEFAKKKEILFPCKNEKYFSIVAYLLYYLLWHWNTYNNSANHCHFFLWFCHIFHTVYIGGVQKMHSNFRITKNETTTILLLRRKETASSLLIAKIHKIVISNQNLIRIQLECV